jgi:integrase
MIKGMQREWQGSTPMADPLLLERPAVCLGEAALDRAPAPPVTMMPPSMTLCSPAWHTLRAAFLADKPGLTAKTLWSYNQAFEIWKDLVGDRAITEIRRADLKLFADHLRDRPSGRGGSLNHKSIERSLGHLKTFMAWAVEAGHVADDRFGDVRGRDKTREERMAGDSRRAFSAAELTQLFSSPLFTQPAVGDEERAAAWFLLIAALTGARTEEIATAPAELVQVGEVWCLDLRQAGTKTRAAPRLVPLLPDLIRLGLPEWAQQQAVLGRSLVQPVQVKTAAAWSKYLNRYINKHIADAPDLVLYSLRHSFRQMLRAANINEELANKVFGHETGTVGAGYGRQLSALEAKAFVDAVRPPIDLRQVRAG